MRALPSWVRTYQRGWLGPDLVAGLVVWSVVTPQAVAYAQIADLPPQAGLIAAPGAMLGYALLGTSRALIVSATTATSALSAAAVGPLAGGDPARFAALSAALAILTGIVALVAGLLRAGAVTDLISTPVTTGYMFGLGLVIALGQMPALVGVDIPDGDFFPQLADLVRAFDGVHGWTLVVGAASVAALVLLRRLAPRLPGTLIVLVLAIVASGLLDLDARGVDVVGDLPDALPDPEFPDVAPADLRDLLPAAFGAMILGAEAIGVARGLATQDGYRIDVNRELMGIGAGNLLAGLTSGFVQSGGASQTAAAEEAGGRTQLTAVIAAALIVLTAAFLTGFFETLPQATLAAIVIVAIASFLRVAELRRFALLRRSAVVLALTALVGVLVLGVLPGMLVAAALSLVLVVQRLSRPPVHVLRRAEGTVAVRIDAPLFYANSAAVEDRLIAITERERPAARRLELVLDQAEIDVEAADMLRKLGATLAATGTELRLTSVRPAVAELLRRAGADAHVRIEAE